MFAIMMLASASAAVVNPHDGNCGMTCCRGTWAETGACILDTSASAILKVRHNHASQGQTRCYEDELHATNGCICQCAADESDFTPDNRYNTPLPPPPPTCCDWSEQKWGYQCASPFTLLGTAQGSTEAEMLDWCKTQTVAGGRTHFFMRKDSSPSDPKDCYSCGNPTDTSPNSLMAIYA
jgi:hypothetical protein